MVRVYDKDKIKEGKEWIRDPIHLRSSELEALASRRNQVVFDTLSHSMSSIAIIYHLAEKTGIPVVQQTPTIANCPFNGIFNYNDGQYIGGKAGLQRILLGH